MLMMLGSRSRSAPGGIVIVFDPRTLLNSPGGSYRNPCEEKGLQNALVLEFSSAPCAAKLNVHPYSQAVSELCCRKDAPLHRRCSVLMFCLWVYTLRGLRTSN